MHRIAVTLAALGLFAATAVAQPTYQPPAGRPVKGDPLADVRILQHVPFVMKAGVIYKDEAQPAAVDKLVASAPMHTESNPMENSF
jgi:hypothetical protein